MTDSITYISRSAREQDGQNLPLLQQQALASIQALAAETWTDHNPTDPGMTLLEVLSFVISDLSYRLGFPIRDLMSWPPQQRDSAESPFWLAGDILPSNGVTLVDYQRMMLDFPEVRAVMLSQDEQRRYQLTLDTEDAANITSQAARLALANKIRACFLKQRNVNDDLASVDFVAKQTISLGLDLAFYTLEDPIDTLVQVLQSLREVISPRVQKRSLAALMDEGYCPDDVLQGPATEQGFAILNDSTQAAFPQSIFASDLINALQEIAPLSAINRLIFIDSSDTTAVQSNIHWRYELNATNEQLLSFSLDIQATLSYLTITIDGQPYQLSEAQKSAIENAMHTLAEVQEEVTSSVLQDLHHYQQGKYRELKQYDSLQHEFPAIYKLIDDRFNGEIDTPELAQVMQLKGFLMLFDQVLADQFAQLESLKSLLALPRQQSFETLAGLFDKMLASETLSDQELLAFWQAVEHLPKTYVSQPISDISGMENLLGEYWSEYAQQGFQALAEQPFSHRQLDRLNRSMGHLLARYAHTTLDANLLQYESVLAFYGPLLKTKLPIQGLSDQALLKGMVQLKQVVDKAMLLMDYPVLSRFRCGGFNYLNSNPKQHFGSYLSQRILRFLGVKDTQTMPLSTSNREGVYLLEGALLWAGEDTDRQSNRSAELARNLYFIVPCWPTRFAHSGFRALLEEMIARETPMHLTAQVIYLERQHMNLFEQLYYAWLNAMTQCPLKVFSGGEEIGQDNLHSEQWLASLSTRLRHFLVSPATADITPCFYHSWISDAVINPSEGPENPTDEKNFRVHYRPLDFLKPCTAIGSAYINPEDPISTKAFNINIQSPNTIEEL